MFGCGECEDFTSIVLGPVFTVGLNRVNTLCGIVFGLVFNAGLTMS